MKKYLLLLYAITFYLQANAQLRLFPREQWYEVKSDEREYTLRLNIDEKKKYFSLETISSEWASNTKYLPQIKELKLEGVHLLLESEIKEYNDNLQTDSIKIIKVTWDNDLVWIPKNNEVQLKIIREKKINEQRIEDVFEKFLVPNKDFTIHIERNYYVNFDPEGSIPQQKYEWYITTAAVSLGSIGTGFFFS